MRSIEFPQANLALAKDQPEYETLHVYTEMKEIENSFVVEESENPIVTEKRTIPWSMTACFELSDEEIEEIVRTKKLWYTQMLFGNQFQPVGMSTQNPFTVIDAI
jgi:hypothetical protein